MKRLTALLSIALLSACATQQISSAPDPLVKSPAVVNDFKVTAQNLNDAQAAGMLPATDPAVACANDALVKTGISVPAGTPPAKTINVVNAGAISGGSIAYIKVQMAKKLTAPLVISPQCLQLLGQFQIDALTAAANPLQTLEQLIGIRPLQ